MSLIIPAIDLKRSVTVSAPEPRRYGSIHHLLVRGSRTSWSRQWWTRCARASGNPGRPSRRASPTSPRTNWLSRRFSVRGVTRWITCQLGRRCIRDPDTTIERRLDTPVWRLRSSIGVTAAVKNPGFLQDARNRLWRPHHRGPDAKDGKVATDGWRQAHTGYDVVDLGKKFGLWRRIHHLHRHWPRRHAHRHQHRGHRLASSLIPVIASGGLVQHGWTLRRCVVEDEGIEGVICGRAIYTGDRL